MDKLQASKKEIPRFLVTGILAVATDYLSYLFLVNFFHINFAKASSFILGSCVAFILNKCWTFESDRKASATLMPFAILYSTTFLVNVGLNHFSLVYISEIKTFAFIIATSASTILNFIGMKFWVFKANPSQGSY